MFHPCLRPLESRAKQSRKRSRAIAATLGHRRGAWRRLPCGGQREPTRCVLGSRSEPRHRRCRRQPWDRPTSAEVPLRHRPLPVSCGPLMHLSLTHTHTHTAHTTHILVEPTQSAQEPHANVIESCSPTAACDHESIDKLSEGASEELFLLDGSHCSMPPTNFARIVSTCRGLRRGSDKDSEPAADKGRALLQKIDIKATGVSETVSVSSNSYNRFMTSKYKDQWSG